MSDKPILCGVCEYRNKFSVVWCSDCDEGLCQECREHHAASRATRDHSIVPISEFQKLPSNILEITQTCPKHNEKYKMYCKKHLCPCCRRCVVESHDDCREHTHIDAYEVIHNVKSSNAFLEMEQMLAELTENLQRIRKDRQDNIKSLKENKTKIEKEIEQTRVLISHHLDKLQERLMKELDAAEETKNKKISCVIASIQEKEREITEYQSHLDQIKQHASDLQTFLAMKHIQQHVTKNEKFLKNLLKEDKMNHVTLSFETENTFEYLSTALNKMGTIILDTKPSDITFKSRKYKEAQIRVPNPRFPIIDDIKLTLRQTVKTTGRDISDCSLLLDGRMIYSNYNGYIKVLKTDGSLDFTIKTGSNTSHIHYIEDSQELVVTSGIHKSITIIDMKNRKTDKSIKVGSWIYGIVHKDGKLFYNGHKGGLCVVSSDNESVTLVNAALRQNSGIAIWSDQLYFINIDDSVTCCDLQGTNKWKLDHTQILRGARGITVDRHGRVYIIGYYTHNVIVISPDGKRYKELLSEKDGITFPQALFFARKKNKLLISNENDVACLYHVSN